MCVGSVVHAIVIAIDLVLFLAVVVVVVVVFGLRSWVLVDVILCLANRLR